MPTTNENLRTAPLAAAALTATIAGCIEPRCPRGYTKKGDTCYRIKDAGTMDASETENR
jgi:hypothetical protein